MFIAFLLLQLYDSIIDKFKTTKAYWWPPTARDLEDQDAKLSPDLKKFLSILVLGQENDSNTCSMKGTRLVFSPGSRCI